MDSAKKTVIASPENTTKVRVEEISKDFGRTRVLDRVSFEIKKGEVLGFLGPNGAGKTTTMRILTGFFPPTQGKVFISEQELSKHPKELKARIGYLPETVNFYNDMRVMEFVNFVAQVKRVPRKKKKAHLEETLSRCGLWDERKKMIGHLSKGYRQRVGLAQALVGDPEVLVLDEPTSGLDPKQIIEIRKLISELGKDHTIILSTHILPEVSMVCDRVLIVNQGRVVATGTTDELEASLKKRHNVYVTVDGQEHKETAFQILEKMEGIEKISVVEDKPHQVSFSLAVAKGHEVRSEISKLFVQHGIPILEIKSGKLSLEEIFMKIIVNEEPTKDFL